LNGRSMSTGESISHIVKVLAESYTKINMCYDVGDYDALERTSSSLLDCLRVPKEKLGPASKIVSMMYKTSDEADFELGFGNRRAHDELFGRILDMAKELDGLLGVNPGSIQDEIHWWYHYRLSRSTMKGKRPNRIWFIFHTILAGFSMYMEHLRRVKAPIKALACTYWLARAGKKHEKDDWTQVESMLRRYWLSKIRANHGRVEPKLILV